MPLTMQDLPTLIVLLEEAPEVRARLRSLLDLDGLAQVPSRLDRIESILERLTQAQLQSEARLDRLTEAQLRSEARLDRLEATVQELVEAQKRTEEGLVRLEATVQKLVEGQIELRQIAADTSEWRKGEEGRRAGELYERQILRRAANLFNFGEGGSPAVDKVSTHLLALLKDNPLAGAMSADQDPFLADVIWWKGDRYAVVEVSLKIDSNDIQRAVRRAEMMRASGVDALPVVIGEGWVNAFDRNEAEKLAVAWKVGDEVSPDLIAYRKLEA